MYFFVFASMLGVVVIIAMVVIQQKYLFLATTALRKRGNPARRRDTLKVVTPDMAKEKTRNTECNKMVPHGKKCGRGEGKKSMHHVYKDNVNVLTQLNPNDLLVTFTLLDCA